MAPNFGIRPVLAILEVNEWMGALKAQTQQQEKKHGKFFKNFLENVCYEKDYTWTLCTNINLSFNSTGPQTFGGIFI